MTQVPVQNEDELLLFKEAMTYLRVSRSTLLRLIASGDVIGHKVGSTWRFVKRELREAVREATV